jgi:hypothetical protein
LVLRINQCLWSAFFSYFQSISAKLPVYAMMPSISSHLMHSSSAMRRLARSEELTDTKKAFTQRSLHHRQKLFDTDASSWFPPPAIGQSSVRSPNEDIPYIDGHDAFLDVVAAIRTSNKEGHFVYLIGCGSRLVLDLLNGRDPRVREAFTRSL